MVVERFTEALERSDHPPELKRMLELFPETLSGFPPKHLKEMLARLECASCRAILEYAEHRLRCDREVESTLRVANIPIVKRNERTKRRHAFARSIPLIGRIFAAEPKLEPLITAETHGIRPWAGAWFCSGEYNDKITKLCAQDVAHWGSETERAISEELLARHLTRDAWLVSK